MATVATTDYDEKNIASVGTLSDGSSFTGLTKVVPVKVTWGNASSGTGSGDAELTVSISSQDELVVTESDESTTRPYEVAFFDTGNNEAWLWIYGSWDSDGSDQVVVLGGTGDGTDYSSPQNASGTNGTGSNPWNNGQNAEMVQHLNEDNYPTDTALDSTVNDNDGTVTGATNTTGEFDGAASFDGTDDNINCGDFADGAIDNTQSLTLLAWVEQSSSPNNNATILAKSPGGTGTNHSWLLSLNQTGPDFKFGIYDNNQNFVSTTSSSSPPVDELKQLVGSYNGASLDLYIDGSNEGSTSTSVTIQDSDTDVFVGAESNNTNNWGNIIDEVRIYSDTKSSDFIQADYDASPKGGQSFFSWNGAETTAQTVALPESTSTGTTPNPQVNAGNVNISAPVTQATGTTPNPAVFSDLFVSIPVSQGNSQNPTPTVVAGNTNVALQESIGTGVTPNPTLTIGDTIRLTPSTGTGTTPDPVIKGGVTNLAVPSSTGTGTTPNPELLFDQVVSAKVSQGIGNTPEPQVTGEAVTITMPVTTADSDTPNPIVSIEIVPRDSSTLSSIKRNQSKTLSGDINK